MQQRLGAAPPRCAGSESIQISVPRYYYGCAQVTGERYGLSGVGLSALDAPALTDSAIRQARAIANSPRDCSHGDIEAMYQGALAYW